MVFEGLRKRFSSEMQGMAIENGGTSPGSGSPSRPASSVLFKYKSWAKLRVRTRFRILDVILNCALFTPLAVLFQVGACGMQDFMFLRYVPPYVGTIILLWIGIGIEFSCSHWQQRLSKLKVVQKNDPTAVSYIVVTRLYHYAIGFANVCHYRGISDIYYYLLGNGPFGAIQAISTTVIILMSLKCTRNILGPPMCLGVDSSIGDFFDTSTYFRTQHDKYIKHFADHAATVLTVGSVCFLHWIAVWALFDCIIFPNNPPLSVVTSWLIGYLIAMTTLILESSLKKISHNLDRRSKAWKLLFEDGVLLYANVGVILIWRGHWMFFESLSYYFPIYHNNTDMSAFYGNFSAFIMMCLLHTSSSLIMKGCDFDGELQQGEGLTFGVNYFAEFFHEEIKEEERMESEQIQIKPKINESANNDINLNNNLFSTTTNNQNGFKQKSA